MGLSSSKDAPVAGSAATAGGSGDGDDGGRSRGRWRGERVRGLACLCLPSSSSGDSSGDEEDAKCRRMRSGPYRDGGGRNYYAEGRSEGRIKFSVPLPRRVACSTTPVTEPSRDRNANSSYAESGNVAINSDPAAAIAYSSNPLSRSRSRFDFIPDWIVTKQRDRAATLESSRACSSLSIQNARCDDRVPWECDGSENSRNGIRDDHLPADSIALHNMSSSSDGEARHFNQDNSRIGNFERRSSRRHDLQDPLAGSIRFSRTLSVGRLRDRVDRVLRRPSFSDGVFDPLSLESGSERGSADGHGNSNGRRALRRAMRSASSGSNIDMFTASVDSLVSSMDNAINAGGYESETPRIRESSIRSTLEHRSAFLERRRRIRSQVRELQWLGNRVGHDRSCILSGHHRHGHCICRTTRRPGNPADGTSTRSSISRIVMLAEALFEVLDEIHQQAVVLASRSSLSSIGSTPAPKEIVERMPLRVYRKQQIYTNEEASQCYICLLEYEDGDCVRTLPCRHEFHRACVDKWLKEIHRVCPLCRGDVCISEMPPVAKLMS